MSSTVAQRPGRLDLELVQGDDAELELTFVDDAGVAVDLSGRAWSLRITGPGLYVDLDSAVDTTDEATGVLVVPFAAATTAAIGRDVTWALRDTTNSRTLLDGELRAYVAGHAGAGSSSITQTVTITNDAAAVTVTAAVVGPAGADGSGSGSSSATLFDVTAAPYNATGDGVADDTAALEAAIDDAGTAGGGIVHLPVGTYKIRRTLFLPANVTLRGEGAGSIITKGDTVTANLTANRTAGGTTITVADTTGFNVGDAVTVSDTTNWEWLATQAVVASKTATTLELSTAAQAAYQTNRAARVYSCFPLVSNVADGDDRIVVRDLCLDQNAGPNDPTNEFTIGVIHWVGAYRSLVENVDFLGAAGDAYSDQSQDGTGLNVTYPQAATIRRSTRNTIRDCRIVAPGRHGVHLGTAQDGAIVTGNEISDIANPLGMALFFCAYSTNAVIDGNLVSNCTQGFAGGDERDTGNVIANNVFQGGTNSSQAGGGLYAISAGAQTVISGNQILDWAGGIRLAAGSTDCVVADNYVRMSGGREGLSILAGAHRANVSGNTFVGGSTGSKPVSVVSSDDCVFTGNLTHSGYQGWSIVGCNRLRILASPIVSATVATGYKLESTASTDVEIDTRGTVQASAVITESTAATRLVVNGVGTNGATNPASGGAWALNPATAANRKWHGVEVHWNDGTDHVSKYQHGVGWIELTGGSGGGGTPSAHAASHAAAGTDPLTLSADQVTSGVFNIARLASGTPTGSKFVRDDGTLAVPAGGGGGGAATDFATIYDVKLSADGSFTIPDVSSYSDLELLLDGRCTSAAATAGLRIRINGDTASSYLNSSGAATNLWNNIGSVTASLTNTNRPSLWAGRLNLGHTTKWSSLLYQGGYAASDAVVGTAATSGSAYYTNVGSAISLVEVYPSTGTWAAGSRLTVRARTAPA